MEWKAFHTSLNYPYSINECFISQINSLQWQILTNERAVDLPLNVQKEQKSIRMHFLISMFVLAFLYRQKPSIH